MPDMCQLVLPRIFTTQLYPSIIQYHTHSILCLLRLLYSYKNLLWRYVYPQFTLSSAIHGKFDKNGRTLRLRHTRGRLELTIPPCIQSSYLLAGNTPTERLVMRQQAHQQAGGNVKTASRFLIAHALCLH